MRLIPPIQTEDEGATDAMAELITASSTIPEPDPDDPAEVDADLYDPGDAPWTLGDRVIESHVLYECTAASTSEQPSVSVTTATPDWAVIGPSNQWKALTLTTAVTDQSTYDDEIVYTIDVNETIDRVALHNVMAATVNVKYYDPDDNLVYDSTESTASLFGIDDEYDWCFKPPVRTTKLANFQIPAYPSGQLVVTLTDTGNLVGIGKIVFGYSEDMGRTLSPVRSNSIDLGRTSRNAYGTTILAPGRVIFQKSFDSVVESSRAGELELVIKNLSGLPCTVLGEEDIDFTIVFGRVLDYQITRNAWPLSEATLKTEEF